MYFSEAKCSSNLILDLYTIKAGALGLNCWGFFQVEWCNFPWPAGWDKKNIHLAWQIESWSLLFWLYGLGDLSYQTKGVFYIDNQALFIILNKQTSKSQKGALLLGSFIYKIVC